MDFPHILIMVEESLGCPQYLSNDRRQQPYPQPQPQVKVTTDNITYNHQVISLTSVILKF
jgi:hypothetical protein